jgi:two-component system sensor kinase ParS
MVWLTHLREGCSQQRAALTQQRNELSQKLERSLEASALAHELGQPLSQLMLQLRLMQFRLEQQPQLAAATSQLLSDVQSSGQQIQELIAAMSRLLRNTDPPSTQVNLSSITRACLQQMAPECEAAGITLSCMGLQQRHAVVGDAKQLEIAILNLLRNAQHSLAGIPPDQRRLQVTLTTEQRQRRLRVADSGPGLPSQNPETLLLNSTTEGGMGLGLLMVSGIAQRHGGELRLGRSASLGGAELCLSFPELR